MASCFFKVFAVRGKNHNGWMMLLFRTVWEKSEIKKVFSSHFPFSGFYSVSFRAEKKQRQKIIPFLFHYIIFILSLSLSLSLSLAFYTHTHTHTLSLSSSLSIAHSVTLTNTAVQIKIKQYFCCKKFCFCLWVKAFVCCPVS